MELISFTTVGVGLGVGLVTWVLARFRFLSRISTLEERCRGFQEKEGELTRLREEKSQLQAREAELSARLESEKSNSKEKLELLNQAREELGNTFAALSSEALKSNNASFLQLARTSLERFQQESRGDLEKRQLAIEQLVNPVKESLQKVDLKISDLEKVRVGAYESLSQQVKSLYQLQSDLRNETSNLVKALRTPTVRGRWGEIQLKRVVEMAGMLDHCDFYEQETVGGDEGRLRPDMVVRLPGEKTIVVDSKVPLSAYLEAVDASSEEARKQALKRHAQQIRTHMTQLSRKGYWDQFKSAPEFVVLFLPGEIFFSAALEQDPALIEAGVDQRVILATPTTLIALLRAVAYGWRQESLQRNAQVISELGKDLYKRIYDMAGHFSKLGKSLNQSVETYNRTVGSLETRVMVSARRFKELDTAPTGIEIPDLSPIEQRTRNQDLGSIP